MWGDIAVGDLGATGLLAVTVLLVLLGLLVPRRSLRDVQKERDDWREAHRISEESSRVLAAQIQRLLQLAETNTQILASLRKYSGDDNGEGT